MDGKAQKPEHWLEIHDSEWSSARLVAEIEERVRKRRDELGAIQPLFPTFGHLSEFPEPPGNGRAVNPNLYYHLRRANEMDAAPTEPVLVPSPATRVPILGRLWRLVRAQFHGLILFYVNRLAAHDARLNNHLISTLNELTRVAQAQQEEIHRLKARIRTLEEERG